MFTKAKGKLQGQIGHLACGKDKTLPFLLQMFPDGTPKNCKLLSNNLQRGKFIKKGSTKEWLDLKQLDVIKTVINNN